MSDLLLELKGTVLSIYNGVDVVGHCFVVSFAGDKDKKTIRPFLLLGKNELLSNNCFISLPVINNQGRKEAYNKTLDFKSLFEAFKLPQLDVAAIPFAHIYSEIGNKNLAMDFKTVQEEVFINEESIKRLASYENVLCFYYNDEINELIFRECPTLTSIKNDYFYIENHECKNNGFPVYLYNRSSFVENNSINLGSRLFLVGIAIESQKHLIRIESVKTIINQIKKKFGFNTDFHNQDK